MKNKLTINKLALGNLKARKKQYTIMIIGIILAMIFSSSIIFFASSARETLREKTLNQFGNQDVISSVAGYGSDEYDKMVSDKIFSDYALAHGVGYAYTTSEANGSEVCRLDDSSRELSRFSLRDGRYPEKEGEIAVEYKQLVKLGYGKASIGDKLKLNVKTQNGFGYLEPCEQEYTLVGIAVDKKANFSIYESENTELVPSIFVADSVSVPLGGKEKVIAYASFTDELKKQFKKYYFTGNGADAYTTIDDYIGEGTVRQLEISPADSFVANFEDLLPGGSILIIVVFVLVFAACVAIVNAFNSNLKERKRQIGMLRAVGATKKQIIKIFGREALIISLIATPISALLSYLLVKLLLGLVTENTVMSRSFGALVLAVIVNVAVVMLASLIPLVSASKITPIQAIRNIENNRILSKKKIRSKSDFSPASLIARRSLGFYKGSKIAVSIILVITVLFTSLASSYVSVAIKRTDDDTYDYRLHEGYGANFYNGINYLEDKGGYSSSDKNEILEKPYISEVCGGKHAVANLLVDEYDTFLNVVSSGTITEYDYADLTSADEYIRVFNENVKSGKLFEDENYKATKQALKIGKEYYQLQLYAYDDELISRLTDNLVDGRIDLEKLASGEEIILAAPQRIEVRGKFTSSFRTTTDVYDDDIDKTDLGFSKLLSAESPYKVGDTVEYLVARGDVTLGEGDDGEYIKDVKIKNSQRCTAKIGAIVSPDHSGDSGIWYDDFCIITSTGVFGRLLPDWGYYMLNLYTDTELDDVTNQEILDQLEYFNKGGYIESMYDVKTNSRNNLRAFIVTAISVMVIGFAICSSIISNSISARIRQSKRVIGTIRAVGADRKELFRTYFFQLLSMFGIGTGIGYGLYVLAFLIIKICAKKVRYFDFITLSFSPWVSLVMSALLLAICAATTYAKIKKETENSIVENIREL